jgi:hypothetical protein
MAKKRNPFLDQPKSENRLMKTIAAQLTYHQIKKYDANQFYQLMKKTDPTKENIFIPWLLQCFVNSCNGNYVADYINDLGLAKDYLEIWLNGQAKFKTKSKEWVQRAINDDWAIKLLGSNITTIPELGSLLINLGLFSTEYQGDWIKKALYLQTRGDCFLLGSPKDGAGNTWVFVDLITHRSSTELGEDSGWCTASGAFYSYVPKTGLIMGYCLETGERIQVTSLNESNLQYLTEEEADEVDEDDFDGFFQEQKLPNNEILSFDGYYAPLEGFLASIADQVQVRVKLADKDCLSRAIENLNKGNGNYTGKYKLIYDEYEGNINFPPLKAVKNYAERLTKFLSYKPSKRLNQDHVIEFQFLLQYIPNNMFVLELAMRRHPIILKQYLPQYLFKSFVSVPQGVYKSLGEDKIELRGFDISKYETTQLVWLYVTGNLRPIKWGDSPLTPVSDVSWFDCCEFCNILSEETDLEPCYRLIRDRSGQITDVDWDWNANGYRLPTEAEWEAAARNNTDFTYAGSDDVNKVAWYSENSQDRVHPVGLKDKNTLGLYDMSGNLWEWCYDSYGEIDEKEEREDDGRLR